ncbi:glycosyltransferase family 9 protein [Rosettibacter firmus]|uniref:glycosyltransferase family 9 protein n=1 Tax=Rosettibacter firmus TaxID=3111522 RepID=UPI00336C27AA
MKILVVNIKYFGDLIISTPAIRSLHKKYPDSEIVVLVRKGFEDVFKNNPYVNSILTFDPEIKGNRSLRSLVEGIKLISKIRKENFDVFIALHPGDRVALLAWLSKAKIRIGPHKQTFSFLFNKKVDVYEDTISYIEYYNKIVSEFNVEIESNETEFFISENEINWANNFLSENNLLNDKFICIHPGASEPSKIWKTENFIELINLLINKSKLKILVLSGPNDKKIVDSINAKLINNSVKYFYSDSILKTAALIKKSLLLVTHDTGTRHLAVALKIPVLALLPEDNSLCWNFYSEDDGHFSLFGKRIKNENEAYLNYINVNDVYKKIGEILKLW